MSPPEEWGSPEPEKFKAPRVNNNRAAMAALAAGGLLTLGLSAWWMLLSRRPGTAGAGAALPGGYQVEGVPADQAIEQGDPRLKRVMEGKGKDPAVEALMHTPTPKK